MTFDFDQIHSRKGTGSAKWDGLETMFGRDDVISMWVADMDFPVAAPIVDALKARLEHPFFGYTQADSGLIDAVVDRMQRKFDWRIQPEWIVFVPGVVPALGLAVQALTRPGDEIIIQEPVYYPFFPVVHRNGCQIVSNPLIFENNQYRMDFDQLERCFDPVVGMRPTPRRIRALILSNPHNPVGRIWNRDELTRMGNTVIDNGAVVLSDEIHCELRLKDVPHTPFAAISEKFEQNCMVCMAPSKTFNLPGLIASSIIIPNENLRRKFKDVVAGVAGGCNVFGLTAMEAAYRHGDPWLEELLVYLRGNVAFAMDFIDKNIPGIRAVEPEGTYLLWMDCRELGMDDMTLRDWMRNEARVGLDDGFLFGAGGHGFQRMNLACPRSVVEQALTRIRDAVRAL